MTTKAAAKKDILRMLAHNVLSEDDIFPFDLDLDQDSPEYRRWDKARNELIEEFIRRGEQKL